MNKGIQREPHRPDALTGLPDRLMLEQHLPLACARAQRMGTVVAVGMVDLDDLKGANDVWGQKAADTLLCALSRRLKARMRGSELIVRFGADEFAIVIEDLDTTRYLSQLGAIMSRLRQAVEEPFEIAPGRYASMDMTVGMALYPAHSQDPHALLRLADAVTYKIKALKTNHTQWWGFGGELEETRCSSRERETGSSTHRLIRPLARRTFA